MYSFYGFYVIIMKIIWVKQNGTEGNTIPEVGPKRDRIKSKCRQPTQPTKNCNIGGELRTIVLSAPFLILFQK